MINAYRTAEYSKIRGIWKDPLLDFQDSKKKQYNLDLNHIRLKNQENYIQDASINCNGSMALSDNERYI